MNSGLEVTRYIPKPGRTPPARLQVVANPFEEERTTCVQPLKGASWEDILRMRGELPAPKAPRASRRKVAAVEPWNLPLSKFSYPEPEDHQGKLDRVHRSAQEGLERIRNTPKSLATLLRLPEWKGASVQGGPTAEDVAAVRKDIHNARIRLQAADTDRARNGCSATLCEHENRLKRMEDPRAIRVLHPSGAVVIWLPL